MIDKNAFHSLSYGLYLLSARIDGRDNACIVDAVMQSSAQPATITLSCMKGNLTREFVSESGAFNLSVLPESTSQAFFKRFGMTSGRDTDKLIGMTDLKRSANGLLYWSDAIAYVSCEVIASQDLGSHVQFTARVAEAVKLNDLPAITYSYYRQRVKESAGKPAAMPAPVSNQTSARPKVDAENGGTTMNKYVCKVCGYIAEFEGEMPADFKCPVCGVSAENFQKVEGELKLAAEHVYGVYGQTVANNDAISADDKAYILEQLKANFQGECSEVGMYLCMARIAHREGYPEIGLYWEKAAYEEAEHAAKFAELLGEELEPNMKASTKENLAWRVDCEFGATAGKTELAGCAKRNGLDAIHDTVHEMARDEARHGKALKGLLERYFG